MSPEQARELAGLSRETGRQIGLLIDRSGRPEHVLVGEFSSVAIPELPRSRLGAGRLRGLRLLHTHLSGEKLSQEDLMDLVFLRLDSVTALQVSPEGLPAEVQLAHLLPPNPAGKAYEVLPPARAERFDLDLAALTAAIEEELGRAERGREVEAAAGGERALLVSVSIEPRAVQEASLDELAELARTAGLCVVGRMVQRVGRLNPRFILGKGKLVELEVMALRGSAQIVLFDQDLSAAQMRNLAEVTERRVLDRTQLILDIFAQHATSRAGKLQVEMAQLKYTLPRLVGKNQALSRLVGGIGGRGPGETKLEIDRRRVRERITRLKQEIFTLRRQRGSTRERRSRVGVPVVSLVGYTNAGKSTLLNTLTGSAVAAENKLFATLDPVSRRIRFPREREVVITDTVGFIRRLPPDLKEAFLATLEELESADLLLHVADASHPQVEEQVRAVEVILAEMELGGPRLLALNKWDAAPEEARAAALRLFPDGIPVSALERATLEPLVEALLVRLPFGALRRADVP
jgi:GTP-binding protein HflX